MTFALVFVLFPEPLFGLLTNHFEVIDQVGVYVQWLLPVLGLGSIAFMLDGYFLGLAEGPILRSAALTSTLLGFGPIALAAWLFHSSHLLWLAMSVFMAARVITLGMHVPRTLRN